MDTYGVDSVEERVKMLLMSDVKVLALKDDMDRLGITEEMITDAKEYDAEEAVTPVSWKEILKGMEEADMVMFF
ncbi:MAG TPA: hypothetical protein ENI78_01990 [Euryarchaeota archaeon]|nr:hypothetical protein [Euryarchaeota archaeon]